MSQQGATQEDDDDLGSLFAAHRAASQERRADNRANSERILAEHDVQYTSKNFGAHLIVHTNTGNVDFWPGTGKWIDRRGGKQRDGRGVHGLLRLEGVKPWGDT